MELFLDPKALSAIISAFVAIMLFFVSQWFLSRRNSVELRTTKLEDLYLSINDLSNQHAIRFEKIRAISNGDRSYLDDPEHILKLYLHDINKSILMFVRLYFPQLTETHQALFRANSQISQAIFEIIEEKEIDSEAFILLFVSFGDHLRAIEEEIIENRKVLVGENILPMKYKRISHNHANSADAKKQRG